jgi:hypothetical protein
MYERDWKKDLTKVFAFENGSSKNVTENYKLKAPKPKKEKKAV